MCLRPSLLSDNQRCSTIIVQLCPSTGASLHPSAHRDSSTAATASLNVSPPYMSPTTEPVGKDRAASTVGTLVIIRGVCSTALALDNGLPPKLQADQILPKISSTIRMTNNRPIPPLG
jgi:hypothetical protein